MKTVALNTDMAWMGWNLSSVFAIAVNVVCSPHFCDGELLEKNVYLTKNTSSSRMFLCQCSNGIRSNPSSSMEELMSECRQKVKSAVVLCETDPCETSGSCIPDTGCVDMSAPTTSPPASCVSDCSGVPDGWYHSCNGCNEYVVCARSELTRAPCSVGTEWNDILKTCDYPPSPTC